MSRVLRLFVDHAGQRPFLDLALDDSSLAIAIDDGHLHSMHRGAVRHREGVDGLDRHVVGVRVSLDQRDRHDGSADLDLDVGSLEGTGADQFAVRCEGFESATFRDLHDTGHRRVPVGFHREDREKGHDREQGRDRETASTEEVGAAERSARRPTSIRGRGRTPALRGGVDPPHRGGLGRDGFEHPVAARPSGLGVLVVPFAEQSIDAGVVGTAAIAGIG